MARLQFRGRPGSNVADFYVDTGSFEADYSRQVGTRSTLAGQQADGAGRIRQGLGLQPTPSGTRSFDGFYVAASYLFNGELRPYDTSVRFSRRVTTGRRLGRPGAVRDARTRGPG